MSRAEAERIQTHVGTCLACQAHLAAYERIDYALRTQRVPQVNETAGAAALLGRLPSTNRRFMRSLPSWRSARWRLWGGLGSAVASLLLIVGFSQLLGRGSPLSHNQWAPVTLVWAHAAAPQGMVFDLDNAGEAIAVAPSDGKTAYGCVTPLSAQGNPKAGTATEPQVWVTHDRGGQWMIAGALPSSEYAAHCALVVDDAQAKTVVATVSGSSQSTGSPTPSAAFLSRDGGQTWHVLPNVLMRGIDQMVSWQGVTYAVRCCDTTPNVNRRLMVSTDNLQTWQPIDTPIVNSQQGIIHIWANPDTGELLVVGRDINRDGLGLWSTRDHGVHWAKLPVPYVQTYVVQSPLAGRPWHVCGEERTPTDQLPSHPLPLLHLYCSSDGGYTWTQRSVLSLATGERHAAGASQSMAGQWRMQLLAETPGGDLVLGDIQGDSTVLYRLPPTSAYWQTLGALPEANLSAQYYAVPAAGVLWALPQVFRQGTTAPPPPVMVVAVYTADYPPDPSG